MSALEEAFKSTDSAPKMVLPPLPVGAPTIQRSNDAVSQIAKREAPKKPKQPVAELPPTVRASGRFKPNRKWMVAILLLLLLGFGIWRYARNNGELFANIFPAPTLTAALPTSADATQPTETFTQPAATSAPATLTRPAATLTAEPSATVTETPTLEPSPTATPVAVPTIKYPDGNKFTLFWNETSFYMLNRSRVPRSFSGFSFERLDLNGAPLGRFPGSLWDSPSFNYVPAKYCVGIKIYKDEDPPYINPPDCHGGFVGFIQPRTDPEDRHLIFWNEREGSTQFRILWLNEEVARCDVNAETCDFYVP